MLEYKYITKKKNNGVNQDQYLSAGTKETARIIETIRRGEIPWLGYEIQRYEPSGKCQRI